MKILVLTQQTAIPDIYPIGKVAGVKSIQVNKLYQERNEGSFVRRTFGGWALIQVARVVSYGIAFIGSLIVLFGLLATVSNWRSKRKTIRLVSEFKGFPPIDLKAEDDFIFQSYIDHDEYYLLSIERTLSRGANLEKNVKELARGKSRPIAELGRPYGDIYFDTLGEEAEVIRPSGGLRIFPKLALTRRLVEAGFVKREGEQVVINERMRNTLNGFIKFLRSRELLSDDETPLMPTDQPAETKPAEAPQESGTLQPKP